MDGAGWAVGADRTAVTPTPAAFSQPGTQTGTGPAGAVRHPVRAVHRDSVEVPAAGVGVRLRDDVLAPVGPVAPAGVWQRLHELLLAELNAADKLDWSKAVIDGSQVRALKGGPKPARARSTVPRPARNTMSSPKARASHWPSP